MHPEAKPISTDVPTAADPELMQPLADEAAEVLLELQPEFVQRAVIPMDPAQSGPS
jgi:hypothetical protein